MNRRSICRFEQKRLSYQHFQVVKAVAKPEKAAVTGKDILFSFAEMIK